jgi:AraC-like DNA-binding protein
MSVAPDAHSFPAAHALQLVTLVSRWDVTADELLEGLGLSEEELAAPHARIAASTLQRLTRRARELTAEPGLGFYLGLQKRISMYGYPGFAAMHAATMREAIELSVRYSPAVTTGLSMELVTSGERAVIRIREHVDLGDVRDVGAFSLLVGMRQITGAMIGRDPGAAREGGGVRVDIPFAEPEYFARFAHLLPGARFDQPEMQVSFPARALDLPLSMPDKAALNLAREACEHELLALGFDRKLSARVQKQLGAAEPLPSIEAAARALGVSTRTLKRKLAAEGVTFSTLLDGERQRRALELLRAPELSLEQIAQQLGYSTLPNFARAFRRWTGKTPAQHRRQSAR